jgi:uncharacterized protein (TIGR03437 family)
VLPGATPAVPGEVIVLYGTGFGPTNPAVDGLVVSSPTNLAANPVITIGSAAAIVKFAGRSAAGLDQINVTVPALPAGSTGTTDVPIRATAGAATTAAGVLITVQPGN